MSRIEEALEEIRIQCAAIEEELNNKVCSICNEGLERIEETPLKEKEIPVNKCNNCGKEKKGKHVCMRGNQLA